MLLHELFEAETKHVTFCFGRMNPPTIGHAEVFKTMSSQGGEMKIFVSQSQDKKKNPLDYATKIKFIKEMFPQYAKDVVENAGLNTIGKVASYLHEQGYNAVTFVAGSDRLEDMKNLLTQYNGVEGKAHGFYKFDVIDFASSGDREDGAEGVAGVSASGARAAAANNDFEAFQEATGAGELAKPLFAAVRKGMGISGEVEEGIKSKIAAATLAGAAALGGGGAQASEPVGPLAVMATIKMQLPDGSVKTIKKDLGHSYDYRLDDARKDLENLLDRKGIKQYTIHLDRYNSGDASSAAPEKNKDYLDKTPSIGKADNNKNYMDKGPYTGKPSKTTYLDKSTGKEFRDMDNY
jgi:hypothetical protein